MDTGNSPEKLLKERKRSLREEREEKLVGKGPERWLCLRLRTRRLEREGREEGKGPWRLRSSRTSLETRPWRQVTPYHEQTVVLGVQFEREFEVSALDLKESKAEVSVVMERECEV